jgi:hypothetical protein
MWYVWTAVVFLSMIVGEAGAAGPAVASEIGAPQAAAQQTPPPQRRRGRAVPPDARAVPAPGAQEEEDEEDVKDIPLPTGPMRVESWAISETRSVYYSDPPPRPPKHTLVLQAKLTGERLVHMVGRSELLVEEMVDDAGAVLKTLADYEPRALTKTYSLRAGKRMLTAGYAGLTVEAPAPSRAARKLAKVRGHVLVAYSTEVEEIMIDNPLQYVGGYLRHPRLEELGVKIKVLDRDVVPDEMRDVSGMALQYEGGTQRHIRKAEFFDAWLKPMYTRDRSMELPNGDEYLFYGVVVGKIDADCQMLLKFYPEVEQEKVSFELTDLELP